MRCAIVAAAVLLVALASVKWLRPAWGHAKLLYWQRLCMRYEQPASQAIDLSDSMGTKSGWSSMRFFPRLDERRRRWFFSTR